MKDLTPVMPVMGSQPGTWGLQMMNLSDKAGQRAAHSFVELMRFTAGK